MSPVVKIWVEGALGRVHLNRPEALNSLTLEMVRLIDGGLDQLLADPAVQAIALTGEGGRALCAGGDIKMLWTAGRSNPTQAEDFWREEYRLDARIHRLEKPWIAVMDGICMGGGVGLSVHGSHRIVTERVKFAMPETGIGYFPDVGGTWALTRAPDALGYWIGMTGATIGAADVLAADLADAMILQADIPAFLADLAGGMGVDAAIAARAADAGASRLAEQAAGIAAAFGAEDVPALFDRLAADGSAFATETLEILRRKSPTSLVLTLELLRAAETSPDLETCLQRELEADFLILAGDDFYEGVRAAVIDKDRNPQWQPARLEDVDRAALLGRLTPQPALFAA